MHLFITLLFPFIAFSQSDYSIHIIKSKKELYLYKGDNLEKTYSILELGQNPEEDKVKKGSPEEPEHYRTPHGEFFICQTNPSSQYYKSFQLSYPSENHARAALRDGIVSQVDYTRILNALVHKKCPPHDTPLGGLVSIHGEIPKDKPFKRGCVVLKNADIDELWSKIKLGSLVQIEW